MMCIVCCALCVAWSWCVVVLCGYAWVCDVICEVGVCVYLSACGVCPWCYVVWCGVLR